MWTHQRSATRRNGKQHACACAGKQAWNVGTHQTASGEDYSFESYVKNGRQASIHFAYTSLPTSLYLPSVLRNCYSMREALCAKNARTCGTRHCTRAAAGPVLPHSRVAITIAVTTSVVCAWLHICTMRTDEHVRSRLPWETMFRSSFPGFALWTSRHWRRARNAQVGERAVAAAVDGRKCVPLRMAGTAHAIHLPCTLRLSDLHSEAFGLRTLLCCCPSIDLSFKQLLKSSFAAPSVALDLQLAE